MESENVWSFVTGFLIFLKIFLMWTMFKVFIEDVNNIPSVFCFVFFWPGGMWDLSSPTRDQTYTSCIGRQRLKHWTAREVSEAGFLN